jgi:MFS family permease
MPAIVNDLAPEHLRGRYNGLTAGCFQGASILGPIVAGFMIGHSMHLEYLVLLVAGCGLVAWLAAARLEGQLDDRANGLLVPATTTTRDVDAGPVVAPVPEPGPVVEPMDTRGR